MRIEGPFLLDLGMVASEPCCYMNVDPRYSPLRDIPYSGRADMSIGCASSGGPRRRQALLSSGMELHIYLYAMPKEQ